MKIKLKDENNIIVFLNNINYNLNINDLEHELKILFDKLKTKYKLDIFGYYIINIYIDNYYGTIIDMKKEEIDYIDYNDEIDMRIIMHKITFLYLINNYYNLNIKSIIYKYNNKYYLKLEESIDNISFSKLLELSEIEYKDIDTIISKGNILQNKTYVI